MLISDMLSVSSTNLCFESSAENKHNKHLPGQGESRKNVVQNKIFSKIIYFRKQNIYKHLLDQGVHVSFDF